MRAFEKQGGISFLILYFSHLNELYYMTFQELCRFWQRAEEGGRKSVRKEELSPVYYMELKNGTYVPYLDMLQ